MSSVISVAGDPRSVVTEAPGRLLLTITEAAACLGIGRSKAYELVAAGRIPSITVGSSKRVPVRALEEWIDAQLADEEYGG